MHESVLLKESIDSLNLKEDSIIVDCTLGYGGHSSEILKQIPKGHLYCFDQDIDAINYSKERLSKISNNFTIIQSNFKDIKNKLNELGITKVDGFLFDLGLSSVEIDNESRGFSYMKDAPLDMRMDQSNPFSAKDVVNTYSEKDLYIIFRDYGEEKYASRIAKKIVEERNKKEIETTFELVDIIDSCIPFRDKRNGHPAKRVFQAIRIEVNKELDVFENALKDAIDLLNVGGRVCVITFHSLEDKICKDIFKKNSEINKVFKGLPNIPYEYMPKLKVVSKNLPTELELEDNNRARSATLRIAEKIKE